MIVITVVQSPLGSSTMDSAVCITAFEQAADVVCSLWPLEGSEHPE